MIMRQSLKATGETSDIYFFKYIFIIICKRFCVVNEFVRPSVGGGGGVMTMTSLVCRMQAMCPDVSDKEKICRSSGTKNQY